MNKEEETKFLSEFLGAKLAIFVGSMNLSDDAKELLIALLTKLSEPEILNLINFLEAKYLSQETELLDIEFENELAKIAVKYGDLQRKVDEETLVKMNNLLEQKGDEV